MISEKINVKTIGVTVWMRESRNQKINQRREVKTIKAFFSRTALKRTRKNEIAQRKENKEKSRDHHLSVSITRLIDLISALKREEKCYNANK